VGVDLLLIFYLRRSNTVSRLQAIATPLVVDMEKVQIIPPPKEVDPRVLAWKGAAVLAKMDGVSELWVTQTDWVRVLSSLVSLLLMFLCRTCWVYGV
jgi:hypothetical protein